MPGSDAAPLSRQPEEMCGGYRYKVEYHTSQKNASLLARLSRPRLFSPPELENANSKPNR
jgi:hypothetical protein